jgi:hypothetical protein
VAPCCLAKSRGTRLSGVLSEGRIAPRREQPNVRYFVLSVAFLILGGGGVILYQRWEDPSSDGKSASLVESGIPGRSDLLLRSLPDVTVRVHGTEGLRFEGTIGGLWNSRPVEGIIPAEFTIPGVGSNGIVTVVIQKRSESGTLEVSMDCSRPAYGQTAAAYGLITLSCSP